MYYYRTFYIYNILKIWAFILFFRWLALWLGYFIGYIFGTSRKHQSFAVIQPFKKKGTSLPKGSLPIVILFDPIRP